MIVGSVAIGLCSSGGFCAGSKIAIDHQRNNGASFVFSATSPALLAVSASEGIELLKNSPSTLEALRENVRVARSVLERVDGINIPSHPASPMIHIFLKSANDIQREKASATLHPATATKPKHSDPRSVLPRDANTWDWDIEDEERALQEVVEDALAQGVMISKAKRLRGQEIVEPRPSIRLVLTAALSKKDTEKAVGIVKASLQKVIAKRRHTGHLLN